MSKEIEDVKQVTSTTEIEVKESIPVKSGKELMRDKAAKEHKEEAESIIEQARAAKKELDASLEENKKVLEEIRVLRAEELLKGRAEAGQIPLKPKEETAAEYAKRILGGKL